MSLAGIGLVFIVLMFLLMSLGLEIGFAMGLIGLIGFAYIVNLQAAFQLLATDLYHVFTNYGFTVIALFILMGQIAANAGIARRLYDTAYRFVGHIPGGLAVATVLGGLCFKAVCGSSPATAAILATVAAPEMDRYRYDKRLSSGTVATVGTLGVLLPPSMALIIYGIIAEQSIARLFLAGILPGCLIALSFLMTILVWCKLKPEMGPKGERSTWKQRVEGIPSIMLIGLIFVLVVGGLMEGYFTPTEAGSVGTFAVLLLAVFKRDITFGGFITSVLDSVKSACMVLILIAGATILGHFFVATEVPFVVADWLGGLSFSRELIMVLIMVIYLIGGSFIDDIAFVILVTPIFLPVVQKLGYDPVWFGIMVMVVLMIGIVIPPLAINVFIVSSITKVPLWTVYKGVYPYLFGLAICGVVLLLFPQISLWLPNLLMK